MSSFANHSGAGKPQRAERSAWIATGLGTGIVGLASALVIIAAPAVVGIFNPDPEVVAMGSGGLRILGLGFVFFTFGSVIRRCLSGAGSTLPPMVTSLASLWLVQLPLAMLLGQIPSLGVNGFWAATAISNVTTALANTFWFKLGRWKRKRI